MAEMRRLPDNASLSQVAKRIREIVRRVGAIAYTDHAREEMAKDALTEPDILNVLKGCAVTERQGPRKYRAQGRTEAGESVEVILILYRDESGLLVCTVWKAVKGVKR